VLLAKEGFGWRLAFHSFLLQRIRIDLTSSILPAASIPRP